MRICNQDDSIPEGLNQKEPMRSKSEAPFKDDRIKRADTSAPAPTHMRILLFIPEAREGGLCVVLL